MPSIRGAMLKSRYTFPIGIDIGNHHMYAVQLKETGQGLAVRGMWRRTSDEKIPDLLEKGDLPVSFFKDMVKKRHFKGRAVVISLPSQSLISFPIQFRKAESESVEAAIVRKSAEHLTFPIEEAILDYPSLTPDPSEDGRTYRATVVAAPKSLISPYVRLFKKAGLTVEAIDFGVSALIRLHRRLLGDIKDIAILCNIGLTQSLLTMINAQSILGQRIVPWGLQGLLDKIMTNIELGGDVNKAKVLLKTHGLTHENRQGVSGTDITPADPDTVAMGRVMYQILTPLVDELVFELHRMVGYMRAEEVNPVFEGVYLYGQAPFIQQLDQYMSKRIGIKTQNINPLVTDTFESKGILTDAVENAPYAMALGLAMRKVPWL